MKAHVDEDVVGDQVGGAPLPQQLLEHVQRQLQLPRLDAHCSGRGQLWSIFRLQSSLVC